MTSSARSRLALVGLVLGGLVGCEARAGWADVPAVRQGELREVKSSLILQPGPAALTDGLDALHSIIARWALKQPVPAEAAAQA